jgi:hypothetical protein
MLWTLLDPGDTIAVWDEFYDSDEEQWLRVPGSRSGGTVKAGDVIRRSTGDITPPVMALLAHLEVLRSIKRVDAKWLAICEQYVAEVKRRLGQRSIGRINKDGSVEPTTVRRRAPTLKTLFKDE